MHIKKKLCRYFKLPSKVFVRKLFSSYQATALMKHTGLLWGYYEIIIANILRMPEEKDGRIWSLMNLHHWINQLWNFPATSLLMWENKIPDWVFCYLQLKHCNWEQCQNRVTCLQYLLNLEEVSCFTDLSNAIVEKVGKLGPILGNTNEVMWPILFSKRVNFLS